MGVIIGPFTTILLPKLSEMYGQGEREEVKNYVVKSIELLSTIFVPVAMLVAALSSSIILFLSSSAYLPASVPVIIVLVVNSIFVSVNILATSLQAVRRTRIFIESSSLAVISNFVLSILLIPRFQRIGACTGYSSITIVSFLVTYYYAKKYDVLRFEMTKIAKIYTAGFVMFFIIFALQTVFLYSPLKLFAYILLGFSIYSGTIKAMGTFSREDLDFVMLLIPLWLKKLRAVLSTPFLLHH